MLEPKSALGNLWQRLNEPETEDRWWFRYPVAAALVGAAWYLVDSKPSLWWMAAFLVLGAAVYAKELSLAIAGLAAAIGIFAGIAALPVPVAIVLAGSIVAYGVMRSRDPDLDTKLPIVGGWFRRRREAKQAALLLAHPFVATLRQAIQEFWTSRSDVTHQLNEDTVDRVARELMDEGFAIARAENPLMENRKRLCEAVQEVARLQVLVMPPPPEEDVTGIRGVFGVSGELKARMVEIVKADRDLREWFDSNHSSYETWDEVWNPVLIRYFISMARVNVLAVLRRELDDLPRGRPDWHKLFIQTQCAVFEHEYRQAIGLPPSLPEEDGWAGLTSLKYAMFANSVSEGARYPDEDWRERCQRVESEVD